MRTAARKHKIGKRERQALETELENLKKELEQLSIPDEDGFKPFYDDVETNKKKVQRTWEIEAILNRGFYHKIIEIKD